MKRDSRGFFADINDALKDKYLVIKFDLCQIIPKQNATLVFAFSKQVAILNHIINYVEQHFRPKNTSIIAHSMGCIVTGLLNSPTITKTILLAPPINDTYSKMQEHFSHKPGTMFDLNGVSKVKRSDGGWTFIEKDFWNDIQNVIPVQLFKQLAGTSQTTVIRALNDGVIPDSNYTAIQAIDSLQYLELSGDHSFSPPHRQQLLDTIQEILVPPHLRGVEAFTSEV